MPSQSTIFLVTQDTAGPVLAALRCHQPGTSWTAARSLLADRKIAVNGILCIEEARRIHPGDRLEVRSHPMPAPPGDRDVAVLHADQHIVVAHKPSGMLTVRHPGDVDWSPQKKQRQPSLDEALTRILLQRERRSRVQSATEPLKVVHRIDRETSGIVVFARTETAQQELIRQFAAHSVHRRYLCIIPKELSAQTLRSVQIRDRGDGLRGSASDEDPERGLSMVTHIRPLRRLGRFSELECRLETGRTNQIRIQLAELGLPLCGDVKYRGPFGAAEIPDDSGAPRLALHAAELGVVHPHSKAAVLWSSGWPPEMLRWIATLQRRQFTKQIPASS